MPQPNERDPSRSPACGARGPLPSALRRATEGPRVKTKARCSALASAARTAALWLLPGPSRPRRGRAGQSPKGRAHDARAFAVGTRTCRQRTSGASSRSRRADARRSRPRGCLSLGYFSLGKQREVTRSPGRRADKHTDVSRFSRNPIKKPRREQSTAQAQAKTRNPNHHHPRPTLPL